VVRGQPKTSLKLHQLAHRVLALRDDHAPHFGRRTRAGAHTVTLETTSYGTPRERRERREERGERGERREKERERREREEREREREREREKRELGEMRRREKEKKGKQGEEREKEETREEKRGAKKSAEKRSEERGEESSTLTTSLIRLVEPSAINTEQSPWMQPALLKIFFSPRPQKEVRKRKIATGHNTCSCQCWALAALLPQVGLRLLPHRPRHAAD